MKLLLASAALCFLIAAPAFARPQQEPQQQQDEKAKKQQDEKQKQAPEQKEEKNQEEPARQQNDKAKQEDRSKQDKQQQETTKQQDKQQKETEKQQRDVEKQQRGSQEQQSRQEEPRAGGQEHAQRAEGGETHHGGRHIPDDRYRAEFGREHHFHVGIHRGETRFVYGGYSFEYVEAWPVAWGYNDDFYVEYVGDDYYLCDVEHPEVRLVVIVTG